MHSNFFMMNLLVNAVVWVGGKNNLNYAGQTKP